MKRPRRSGRRLGKSRDARNFRPRLEPLEDRRLLSVFWVDNDGDLGDADLDDGKAETVYHTTTLRAAIQQANHDVGVKDTIAFRQPLSIRPDTNLPEITDPLVIDGYLGSPGGAHPNTFPFSVGNNANLTVVLDGTLVGPDGVGLRLKTENSEIRGLTIIGFQPKASDPLANGVAISMIGGGGGHLIEGNFLGVLSDGQSAAANACGVLVGSSHNIVRGNVVSGNTANAIHIGAMLNNVIAPDVHDNAVQGNYVGTTAAGDAPLGNRWGITVCWGAHDSLIGGTDPDQANLVSGNGLEGILVLDNAGGGNRILGNFVGTDSTGTAAIPNLHNGVVLASSGNRLGDMTPGARNVISGNGDPTAPIGSQVLIQSANDNWVQGNLIGTDISGAQSLTNNADGVVILHGSQNHVEDNTIAGNTGLGVAVEFRESKKNTVRRNNIGTDVTMNAKLGNTVGVVIDNASETEIRDNVISCNTLHGICIMGSAATRNSVLGNFIGAISGGQALDGINIQDGASENIIGGVDPTDRNVISGNGRNGVRICGAATTKNEIYGNFIGTDVSGMAERHNTASGVFIQDASETKVGGPTRQHGNVISGNYGAGVEIVGATARANLVYNNYIGTNRDGTGTGLGNADGVLITDAPDNCIGNERPEAPAPPLGNIISGNKEAGLRIRNSKAVPAPDACGNFVQGNWIGVDIGSNSLGNGGPGVHIVHAAGNVIGEKPDPSVLQLPDKGAGNTISANQGGGVRIEGPHAQRNCVRRNRIFRNVGLEINLVGGKENKSGVTINGGETVPGVTANDHGDGDNGPNKLLNFPVGVTAWYDERANVTYIGGVLDTNAATRPGVNPPELTATVDLYTNKEPDESGFGGGRSYLGSVHPRSDGVFHFQCWGELPTETVFLSALAVADDWSTSEFSPCYGDPDGDGRVDSDEDGLPDAWEVNGLDFNCDGKCDLDLPNELFANPKHADVFLEYDYMAGHKPEVGVIGDVKTAFKNAPVFNRDFQMGITLHASPSEAEEIAPVVSPLCLRELRELKAAWFGTPADRTGPERFNRLGARRLVYHYCIFGNKHGVDKGNGVVLQDGCSGQGELLGDDFMVTLGGWNYAAVGGKRSAEAATFMHELGHNLGLHHGGPVLSQTTLDAQSDVNYKPNYFSIMNYAYQFAFPGYTQGRPMDYSCLGVDDLGPLDELHLKEGDGIKKIGYANKLGSAPGQWPTTMWCIWDSSLAKMLVGSAFVGDTFVNWNMNAGEDPGTYDLSINEAWGKSAPSGIFGRLEPREDWTGLILDFRASWWNLQFGADSASEEDEPEIDLDDLAARAAITDGDGDGLNDAVDNAPFIANPGQEDSDGDGVGDVQELRSLTLSRYAAEAGETILGTVELLVPAPAEGLRIELVSTEPWMLEVPLAVDVPAGATRATFTISATALARSNLPVTIVADLYGSLLTADVTLSPPAPPVPTIDLDIAYASVPDEVSVGDTVHYTITVTNRGPEDLGTLDLFYPLRQDVRVVSASGTSQTVLEPGPGLRVRFDYTYDTNHFFDTQEKKDLLQAAADSLLATLGDSLAAIAPGGGNSWTAQLLNPSTGLPESIENLTVAENELVVFVGGRDLGSDGPSGYGGPGGWTATGSSEFVASVETRGQNHAGDAAPTDFGPWGGSIAFTTNPATEFYFGDDPWGHENQLDFFSAALHEVAHVLGFGSSPSWQTYVDAARGVFTGPASVAEYGFDVPLDPENAHWHQAIQADQSVMDSVQAAGARYDFTLLDLAALKDVGWNTDGMIARELAVAIWPPVPGEPPKMDARIQGLLAGGTATVAFEVQPWTVGAIDHEVSVYLASSGASTFLERVASDTTNVLPRPPLVVNTTDDVDDGNPIQLSLREALRMANEAPGPDTIWFNLPGPGPHTIRPTSALPSAAASLVIDGTTQPGYAGSPLVELDGSLAGPFSNGLSISGDSVVRGLAINRFHGSGIALFGGGNALEGNYVGTDVTGMAALGNAAAGITVFGSGGDILENRIGGTTVAARNVISGNLAQGILLYGDSVDMSALGVYGGILGNYIGVAADGITPLGNASHGIEVSGGASIGGRNTSAANTIAYNGGCGVVLNDGRGADRTIGINAIFSNAGLGIDWAGNGVTPNLAADDTGLDNWSNYPVLSYASSGGGSTTVWGTITAPSSPLGGLRRPVTLMFYASPTVDPSGYGEGKTYLGSATRSPSGETSFLVSLPVEVPLGQFVTATATTTTAYSIMQQDGRIDSLSRTSEFSAAVEVIRDSDGDGVDDTVEDGAPKGGDANQDGTPDRLQADVASLPNAADGRYVTLQAAAGSSLRAVRAVPNPSPANAPPGVSFPVGFFEFIVPCDSGIVTLIPPAATPLQAAYFFGPTLGRQSGHWEQFSYDGTTGAEFAGNQVVLHYRDAARGDNDLDDNSQIAARVGPANVSQTVPTTLVVNTTDDTRDGDWNTLSLREAIELANLGPGVNTIAFNIPGLAVHTIRPTSPLPAISDPVIVDGTTQPGYAGAPVIELDGSLAGPANGLLITAGASTIRGLAINRFQTDRHWVAFPSMHEEESLTLGNGILLAGGGNNVLEGNYLGTDLAGAAAQANQHDGILILGSSNNRVGGALAAQRNVISGNARDGVLLAGADPSSLGWAPCQNNTIEGNYIGLTASGDAPLGNHDSGVALDSVANNTIGGPGAEYRNVISANAHGISMTSSLVYAAGNSVLGNYVGTNAAGNAALGNGIGILLVRAEAAIGGIEAGAGNLVSGNGTGIEFHQSGGPVLGNWIGTAADGVSPLGNASDGIWINPGAAGSLATSLGKPQIGGTQPGQGNTIAYNGGAGVRNPVNVRGNAIFDNAGLGIDKSEEGVTANPPANGLWGAATYGYPTLTRAFAGAGVTNVEGTIVGAEFLKDVRTCHLDFYASPALDPTGYGEGRLYLGSLTLRPRGETPFFTTLPVEAPPGSYITATNTVETEATSEFSAGIEVRADADGDGVLDTVEDAAPHAGDANQDGTPDRLQNHIASLPNAVDGSYVVLEASSQLSFRNVRAIEVPSPQTGPPGVDFPVGAFEALLAGTGEGTVTVWPPLGTDLAAAYAFGPTPSQPFDFWYALPGVQRFGDHAVVPALAGSWRVAPAVILTGEGTTIVVNSSDDVDDGVADAVHTSLREAINLANRLPGKDRIVFDIPGSGPHTIQPLTDLPIIQDAVVIDGYTQPGAVPATGDAPAALMIKLKGSEDVGVGLCLLTNNSVVCGLVINRFNTAVAVGGTGVTNLYDNNVIEGNYIGTDTTGTSAYSQVTHDPWAPSSGLAILSSYNTVGGTTPAARNVIAGFDRGVALWSNDNQVLGNFIGTDATGTVGLGNLVGVRLEDIYSGTTTARIGGAQPGAGNVISGNEEYGIDVGAGWHLSGTLDAVVQGNFIGTDVTGTAAIPNGDGVAVATTCTIGGIEPGAGNLISGNQRYGISFWGEEGPIFGSNTVQGNLIGTDLSGSQPLPNGEGGIWSGGNSYNLIGGMAAGAGNTIAFNGGVGVFANEGSTNWSILGNSIFSNESDEEGNGSGLGIELANGEIDWSRPEPSVSDLTVEIVGDHKFVRGTASGAPYSVLQVWLHYRWFGEPRQQSTHVYTDGNGTGQFQFSMWYGASSVEVDHADVIDTELYETYEPVITSIVHTGEEISIAGTLEARAYTSYVLRFYFVDGDALPAPHLVFTDQAGIAEFEYAFVRTGDFDHATAVTAPYAFEPRGQGSPEITAVTLGSATTIEGFLDGRPNGTFRLEFFASREADPSGCGEGEAFLTSMDVTADADGIALFSLTVPTAVPFDHFITATATDYFSGSTSEFSVAVAATVSSWDFGDAPDPGFPTLLPNGACHAIVSGLLLGSAVDAEADGLPADDAAGDDRQGIDDEDGVVFATALCPGMVAGLDVTASASGLLDAWIDFSGDGTWNESDEQIFQSLPLQPGRNTLFFVVPSSAAVTSRTCARFRLSSSGGLSPGGPAGDGEVEDYAVAITGRNLPPVAADDAATTAQGQSIALDVMANDSDPDGNLDPASLIVRLQPQYGSTAVDPATGAITYWPDASFHGTDILVYEVRDDGGLADTAVVTIEVQAASQPPDAKDDAAWTLEDQITTISVLLNDTDPQDTLDLASLEIAVPPAHGLATVDAATGEITYTPAADFSGTDSFTYRVANALGLADSATAIVTVEAIPDPPNAADDFALVAQDSVVVLDVLANDTDPDGDLAPATLILLSGPSFGTAEVDPATGTVAYSPFSGFAGSDRFVYRISDSLGACDTAAVSIDVVSANAPPRAANDDAVTSEEVPVLIDVAANDTDPEGSLLPASVILYAAPRHGSIAIDPQTGAMTYTPERDFYGRDDLAYRISDSQGASDVAIVQITVLPVNDPPQATDDRGQSTEPAPIILDVLVNDLDVDGNLDPSSVTVTDGPANGSVAVDPATGRITYTPLPGFSGADGFRYQVSDAAGASAAAAVFLDVLPRNNPPDAGDDAAVTNEDTPLTLDVTANDNDPDENLDPRTVRILRPPLSGSVVVDPASGLLTFTPAPDSHQVDLLIYEISDTEGAKSTATVVLSVNPVNDPPSFLGGGDQTVQQDAGPQSVPDWATSFSAGPDNESSQTLTFLVSTDNDGLFDVLPSVDAQSGWLTFAPAAQVSGVAHVTVALKDDGGTANGGQDTSAPCTFTITVNPSLFEPISIRGAVFKDLDSSGLKTTGEPTLSGWTVQLFRSDSPTAVASISTDAGGTFCFDNLGAGTYQPRLALPPGWVQTSVNPPDIPAQSGIDVSGIMFGVHSTGLPTVVARATLDDGQLLYTEAGTWSSLASGWNRRCRTLATDGTGSGSRSARWVLRVNPGVYEVFVTYAVAGANSTSAPYTISSGTTPVATISRNQQLPPDDAAYRGANWESLGVFNFTSNTRVVNVSVQLKDQDTSGRLVADGVMLVSFSGGSPQQAPMLGPGAPAGTPLTAAALDPVVEQAKQLWIATGLTSNQQQALDDAQFIVTELPEAFLGTTSGRYVYLDAAAAGYGWFIDPTPVDSQEFVMAGHELHARPASQALGRMDLLTVVSHELGHILGLEDLGQGEHGHDLLDGVLESGTRRLPPMVQPLTDEVGRNLIADTKKAHDSVLSGLETAETGRLLSDERLPDILARSTLPTRRLDHGAGERAISSRYDRLFTAWDMLWQEEEAARKSAKKRRPGPQT